jgi:lipoyl(octanoyl) transferase
MIAVLNLGRCDYPTALRLQERLVELRQQGRIPNVVLFLEHPPVITLGRNARAGNIVASRELLAARGVEVHEINRGGDVTYHGLGQLIAYPIFDLRSFLPRLGAVAYVRLLEDVLMRVCAHYGVETQRIAGLTGVWTYPAPPPRLAGRATGRDYVPEGGEKSGNRCDDHAGDQAGDQGGGSESPTAGATAEAAWPERKIAAIGVHIARGVTSHGFALNVTTELEDFRLIVPCGLSRPVTSIAFESGNRPALDEVMVCASRCFGDRFGAQMLWLDSIHDLLTEGPEGRMGMADAASTGDSPGDTPARASENERRIAGEDTHLA